LLLVFYSLFIVFQICGEISSATASPKRRARREQC